MTVTFCSDGDDTQIRRTFSTHEITVKGSRLAFLLANLRDATLKLEQY
jgi:hypothetical protein